MADNSDGNGGLYFIVGALVVVVAVLGAAMTGHMPFFGGKHVDIVKIEAGRRPASKHAPSIGAGVTPLLRQIPIQNLLAGPA